MWNKCWLIYIWLSQKHTYMTGKWTKRRYLRRRHIQISSLQETCFWFDWIHFFIPNIALRNKTRRDFNRNSNIFTEENTFQNVCTTILPQPYCVVDNDDALISSCGFFQYPCWGQVAVRLEAEQVGVFRHLEIFWRGRDLGVPMLKCETL